MFSFKTYFESHLQTYSLSQPNEKNYPYQNFYKPFFIITILSSLFIFNIVLLVVLISLSFQLYKFFSHITGYYRLIKIHDNEFVQNLNQFFHLCRTDLLLH